MTSEGAPQHSYTFSSITVWLTCQICVGGRREGVQPERGEGAPDSFLAFNIKDLGRKAMVPVAQFGKTWAVTFRFKPFPVAQREKQRDRDRKRERKKERG